MTGGLEGRCSIHLSYGRYTKKPPTVGAPGFEPGTSWSQTRRATKLRYAPSGAREANEVRCDNQPGERNGAVA